VVLLGLARRRLRLTHGGLCGTRRLVRFLRRPLRFAGHSSG
jgi:hypothetical protein